MTFKNPPNFETPTDADANNVYLVQVQASDGQGGLTTQLISVTVTNAVVTFTSADMVSVPENTTAVTTVVATSSDGTPTYSIVSRDPSRCATCSM